METVRRQVANEIQQVYLESAHDGGKHVDLPRLDRELRRLMVAAGQQGLRAPDFAELARSTLPADAHLVSCLVEAARLPAPRQRSRLKAA